MPLMNECMNAFNACRQFKSFIASKLYKWENIWWIKIEISKYYVLKCSFNRTAIFNVGPKEK